MKEKPRSNPPPPPIHHRKPEKWTWEMERGPGDWKLQRKKGNHDGEEGETSPFRMETHLVRKRENISTSSLSRRPGTVWHHFQGFFLLQKFNCGDFLLLLLLSARSVSLSLKTKLVAPQSVERYERNQAGPEKMKVAPNLGSLRFLWHIHKGAFSPQDYILCEVLNICI